jgi:hypothetical protein
MAMAVPLQSGRVAPSSLSIMQPSMLPRFKPISLPVRFLPVKPAQRVFAPVVDDASNQVGEQTVPA